MTRIGAARRAALLASGLLAAVGGSLAAGPASQAARQPATRTVNHTTTQASLLATPTEHRTTLTFAVDGCGRCRVRLYQAIRGRQDVWESRSRRVRDGRVTFDLPTRRTHGLSASVRAPWEGNTGFVTQVAVRYAHEAVGSNVTNRVASRKHRASGCWAGTGDAAVTVPLTVRRATIPGVDGSPTTAVRAWISTTADWWRPMLHAYRGVLGAQDVVFCRRP